LNKLYEIYSKTGQTGKVQKVYQLIINVQNGIKNNYREIERTRQ
jgi:hypothetical protein